MIVIGDFAENYQFLVQDEIQYYHWSKKYCTLQALVLYFIDDDGDIHHNSLCFMTTTIFFKIIVIDYLKENLPIMDKIFHFSEDCAEQYKNSKNFINLSHHQQDLNMDTEWIYSWQLITASHHMMVVRGLLNITLRNVVHKDP